MSKLKKRWAIKRRFITKSRPGRSYWRYVRLNRDRQIVTFYDRNAAELARIRLAESCSFGLDDVRVVER